MTVEVPMAKGTNRLTARGLASALKKPGIYSDGAGLYFKVRDGGSAQWVFVSTRGKKRLEVGLGGYQSVPLADAREKAQRARQAIQRGDSIKGLFKPKSAMPSFGKCADDLIDSMAGSWRNPKHRAQWETTLSGDYELSRIRIDKKAHASHVTALKQLRDMPVDTIETGDILSVLKPIWTLAPETASRLRGRIEAVLSYAKAHGHRVGENPAAWRGHLDAILPARTKLTRGHQKALSYKELPSFVASLRQKESISCLCLEFLILTAVRSGEARGATWNEFNIEEKLWIIPASRMKAGKEHRVPLSERVLVILKRMKELATDDFVFPGARKESQLTDAALSKLAKELGGEITVHGFRSAFRDWVGDETHFPREIAETALAHTLKDSVEAAYRRSDAIEKRRALMTGWADYCEYANTTFKKILTFNRN